LILFPTMRQQCEGRLFSACVFFSCKSRFSFGSALDFLNRAVPGISAF
jgi:hypothetical protein